MPQNKNDAPQLEGEAKAPGDGLVRRQLRAMRNKIPTKEAVAAGSRRIVDEGASVIGKKMNQARVAVGLLSQNFKRPTKRRKLLVESPPATPVKGRRSVVDLLISPFAIQSPVRKREPAARSTYVTPRRRYLDIWEASSGRATLIPETTAYRNGSLGISDVITPAGSKTPGGLPNTALGGDPAAAPVTPGLSADVKNINEGMRHLHAIADRFAGKNNSNSSATSLR